MNIWDVIVEVLKKNDSYLLSDYPYRVRPYPCCDPVHLRILLGIAIGFLVQRFYHKSEPFAW